MKTTVIVRAYVDEGSARGIRARLYRQGFPRHHVSVVSPEGDDRASITDRLTAALVPEDVAGIYADRIDGGSSVVVVHATYKPLCAVRKANETFATSGALDVGIIEQQFKVPTPPDPTPNIMKDHPLFLTLPSIQRARRGLVSEQFGLQILSVRRPGKSVMSGGKKMLGGKAKSRRRANSTISGGRFMSRAFWPMPLLSKKTRPLSVIPNGGHPFSRLLAWPLR